MKNQKNLRAIFVIIIITLSMLLLIINDCHGQMTQMEQRKANRRNSLVCEGMFMASIACDAMGDALNAGANGDSWQGHALQATSILILLVTPMIVDDIKKNWFQYGAKYVTLRFATFDPIYYSMRGMPINTISDVSMFERFYKPSQPFLNYMMRGLSLIISISIPLNKY